MNPVRFARKLVYDRTAAAASARLAMREMRGNIHWSLRPESTLTYRLPTGGVLLLGRDDSFTQCYWPGTETYEPDIAACLRRYLRPGQTFIDCGANIGLFSIMAWGLMKQRGRVVAIEANPHTQKRLTQNLQANGLGEPVACAVADAEGELSLYLAGEGDVYSSLSTGGIVSADSRSVKVPAKSLDRIVQESELDAVDIVKVDVEGAEMSVLRSAAETVRRFRPWLTLEYGSVTWQAFGSTATDLLAWCDDYDYAIRVYDLHRRGVADLPTDTWSRQYLNLILIPNERIADFSSDIKK